MKTKLFYFLFILLFFIASKPILAQSEPVLYFCEKYDADRGEVGVSDRFTTGYLTVVVKCSKALNISDCSIQFDKYNFRTGEFEYYKKFTYHTDPSFKYVYFAKNDESDMKFDDTGIYRVFLLDASARTVTSSLIEIVSK